MTRKWVSILLTVLIVMSTLSVMPLAVGAEESYVMTLTADKSSYSTGETVYLTVTLDGIMAELSAVQLSIAFDSTYVTTDVSGKTPKCWDTASTWYQKIINEEELGYISKPAVSLSNNLFKMMYMSSDGYYIDEYVEDDFYYATTAKVAVIRFTVNKDIENVSNVFTLGDAMVLRNINGTNESYDVETIQISETIFEDTEIDEAVQTVIDLIYAIGEVTLDSEEEIVAARIAYESLTDEQKAYVINYDELETAELFLDMIKEEELKKSNYSIKWMAGYTSTSQGNETGTLADGCEDIPYYITLTLGGEPKTYGYLGGNWGYAFQIANIGFLNFDITPQYSGLYRLDISTASLNGGDLKIFVNGELADTFTAVSTGNDVSGYTELKEAASIVLAGGEKATISFSRVTKSISLKDCMLTLIEQPDDGALAVIDAIDAIGEVRIDSEDAIKAAEEAYEALSDVQKKFVSNYDVLVNARTELDELLSQFFVDEVIKWKAGYKTSSGTLPEGYAEIPYYVTLATGEEAQIGKLGVDYGHEVGFYNNDNYLNFDVTTENSGIYRLDVQASSRTALPEVLHAYANDEEIGTLYIADGDLANYKKGLRTIGYIKAEAGTPVKISLSNRTEDDEYGIAGIYARDITLTFVGQKVYDLINEIDTIGEISLDSEDKVIELEETYDALSDRQKELVTNYHILVDIRTAFDKLYNMDINDDNLVDNKDATALLRYLAGWNIPVDEQKIDIDGNGALDSRDATTLMRYLAGWDVTLN